MTLTLPKLGSLDLKMAGGGGGGGGGVVGYLTGCSCLREVVETLWTTMLLSSAWATLFESQDVGNGSISRL